MVSRLLCGKLLQLNGSLQTLKQSSYISACMKNPVGSIHVQPLHLKTYDKDAGLEAKRESNKREYADEFNTSIMQRSAARPQLQFEHAENPELVSKPNKKAYETSTSVPDDPDVFGNSNLYEELPLDPGDVAEEEYISNPTRRDKKLRTKEYAALIKEHLNAKRLKAAIDVLEQRMLKEDRVKPENYIYNLLISGCAKAGYTRKAFSLFTKMRQRGLKITGGTYTSLFNACATAPSAKEGLDYAHRLREIMLEKGFEPGVINYNVMIKAYGRCGDVKTAFMLADEMMERNMEVNTSTYNFLLQACASDAEYGFRHCLLTWHKMLKHGIKPDHYSFNTILRCVRDCGFGDLASMDQVLKQIFTERQAMIRTQSSPTSSKNYSEKNVISAVQPQLADNNNDNGSADTKTATLVSPEELTQTSKALQVSTDSNSLEMPNLLALNPHIGSLISISEVTDPHHRFLLLGGLTGFLELMKQYNITPGIESFTAMLEIIPPTNAAEKQLISFVRKIGLKSDIDFFNVLIKKRSMRFDYEGAKEVLSMIRTAGLHPDIVTYGVLALGCQTEEEARELLQRMRDFGVKVNIQILGAMLRQGSASKNFSYITGILQISLDENVKPNDVFLRHLHSFVNQCARAIDARHPYTRQKAFQKGHAKFCAKLRLWNAEQGIDGLKLEDAIKKLKERPYKQYKEEDVDGMEPLKNEKLAKKNKARKFINKIKIDNLKGDDNGMLEEKMKRIE